MGEILYKRPDFSLLEKCDVAEYVDKLIKLGME